MSSVGASLEPTPSSGEGSDCGTAREDPRGSETTGHPFVGRVGLASGGAEGGRESGKDGKG